MNNLDKIPCSKIVNKNGKTYTVNYFGINGHVIEEHHFPLPTKRIIRTFDENGDEVIAKRKEKDISLWKEAVTEGEK